MRCKGEGNVYQRKNGLWQASLQVEGKRRYVYGKTRSEVVRKLADLRKEGVLSTTHTLGELASEWLGTKHLKAHTMKDYQDAVRLYLKPLLSIPLGSLTPEVIERHYASLQQQGRYRGARKAHGCLAQSLALAVRWGWLAHNPLSLVKAPSYAPKQKEMWTEAELRTFLSAIEGEWLEPLYLLLLTSGCRLGEALALTWEDIGPDAILICKTAQRIHGERSISTPKTLTGRRKVAVPAEVLSRLRHNDGLWVFMGKRGLPLESSSVQGNMRRICRQLGIPAMSPHGLRHLHASILLGEGLSVPQVSRRLGHADSATTLRIYAHVLSTNEEDAVKAMTAVLKASPST